MSELVRALKLTRRLLPGYTPTITKLWIEVTDKCNSQCRTCSIWSVEPTEKPLTPEEIYETLTDPVFKDVDYIINSGGEPTTRADLLEFLEFEHYALPNAIIQLSTNGIEAYKVLWVVATLLERHPTMKMEIGTSLEGIGIDHDYERRVPGNFDSVTLMINQLNEMRKWYGDRLKVGFGTVVTDRTINHIPEIRSYADEKGVGCLLQWYNQSPFYSNTVRRGDDVKELSRIREEVKGADYTVLSEQWCNYLDGKPIEFNCMARQSFCVIKCNGDIVPCLTHWNMKMGNVRDNSPSNIFKRRGGITCEEKCLNSWAVYWSLEGDPIQYVRYFARHPIKLVKKLCG